MEAVYIFLYSERDNTFESTIHKACTHYNLFELRARVTVERDVRIYTFLSTVKEISDLNKLINNKEEERVLEILSKRTLMIQK